MTQSALMNFLEETYDKLEERYLQIQDVTNELLLKFADTGKKKDIPIVIAGITGNKDTRQILSFFRENGLQTVDMSVDLKYKENTNYPHDGHPSALANKKYAVKLGDFLEKEVLTATVPPK